MHGPGKEFSSKHAGRGPHEWWRGSQGRLTPSYLVDAVEHPKKYPSLTIRVSGYGPPVNFVRLTFGGAGAEQQMDVINRTFHGAA